MKTVKIVGMSCGHCVAAVTKALSAVPGVKDVRVDLAAGTATYEESSPVNPELLREAVRKAGFQVG